MISPDLVEQWKKECGFWTSGWMDTAVAELVAKVEAHVLTHSDQRVPDLIQLANSMAVRCQSEEPSDGKDLEARDLILALAGALAERDAEIERQKALHRDACGQLRATLFERGVKANDALNSEVAGSTLEINGLKNALAERDAEIEHYKDQYEMLLRYNEAKLSECATLRTAAQQGLDALKAQPTMKHSTHVLRPGTRARNDVIATLTAALEAKNGN